MDLQELNKLCKRLLKLTKKLTEQNVSLRNDINRINSTRDNYSRELDNIKENSNDRVDGAKGDV